MGLVVHEGPGESIFGGALNLEPLKLLWLISKREIYWMDWVGETHRTLENMQKLGAFTIEQPGQVSRMLLLPSLSTTGLPLLLMELEPSWFLDI